MSAIDSVDFFYLSLPEVKDIGDGSQDALLVRVRAGSHEGWGECEAAPLPSIAAWCCPMSHSACKPVKDSVLGAAIESPDDIRRLNALVRANSLDLLQAEHTLSGIDIALWDLLGKIRQEPVYRLLGIQRPQARLPYASQLFGNSPQQTLTKAKQVRREGYFAAKFGWGPYGLGDPAIDADHVAAAREGLGADSTLLVDAGTVWLEDVEKAALRLPALEKAGATWLEEPFHSGAVDAYSALAGRTKIAMAGGEGCHHPHQARLMMDHGRVRYIQIDTGRIGGISSAREVAEHATRKGVTYVNHTFTSDLALSASLQPYADARHGALCEYPVEASKLARAITRERILPDLDGHIRLPDRPGLGLSVNTDAIKPYLVDSEITVAGKVLYRTPAL